MKKIFKIGKHIEANHEPPELLTTSKGVSEKKILGPGAPEKLIWAENIIYNL